MTRQVEIRPGDSIVAIAYMELHPSVDAVLQHPGNTALRERRPDPGVLARGDILTVADGPTIQRFGLSTAREHEIVLTLPIARLRLQLVRPSGVGYAAVPVTAAVDGRATSVIPDADGHMEVEIPATAREVVLSYGEQAVLLRVAHLEPVDTVAGQIARLENLGYRPGPIEGAEAADPYALWSAIEEFQCDHGLEIDGILGEQTRARLLDVHGA